MSKPTVQVKKYKGERAFAKDAQKMIAAGWHIEGQSTRKQAYSALTGVFTNRGISTVTWIKDAPVPVPAPAAQTAPAGWFPDQSGRHEHRYWDGSQWTEHVADAGVQSSDPLS